MKIEMIEKLKGFKKDLDSLREDVRENKSATINLTEIRSKAEALATRWIAELGDHLRQFELPEKTITDMNESMDKLYRYSLQGNRKTSYIKVLDVAYRRFNARFIVPVQKSRDVVARAGFDSRELFPNLSDSQEFEYMEEAVGCANAGYFRAAVVMGWCAAINRIHNHIWNLGHEKINETFASMKQEKRGKFKNFTKNLSVHSLSSVQEIADRDLILFIERLGLVDSNQATRIRTHLDHRNQSAHPGQAPIDKDHVKLFFSDIGKIIFDNPKMQR